MPHRPVFRVPRARLILALTAPILLGAAACDDEENGPCAAGAPCVVDADSVVIEPATSDSVVIEPASAGGTAARLAIDSVVIEPTASGRRLVRVYPR